MRESLGSTPATTAPAGRRGDRAGRARRARPRCAPSRLSGGQQRRLDVGLALIGDPELLFLDEPTTGFDPSARRQAWEMIAGLRDLGKTVFLTTHYMDEAQRLADRVTVIAGGEIVAEGTPEDLGDREQPADDDQLPGRRRARSRSRRRPRSRLAPADRRGADQGLELEGLEVTRPSLEDVYLSLTAERGGAMSGLALVAHQFRYDQKAFWRNPAAVFFTVGFPVILLLIFATVFGDQTVDVHGGIKTTAYYVPAIITLAVISATMQRWR